MEHAALLCLVIQSCLTWCNPKDCGWPNSSVRGDSPGKNIGVGCHALLQRIFPTQGSNPGLPHHRQIVCLLSYQVLLFSLSVISDSLYSVDCSMLGFPVPLPFPGTCSNSSPLSWWCHPTISSSLAPFSSCPQSFPASGSFPVSWLFTSGALSIGASALASVLPMNIQGWFF